MEQKDEKKAKNNFFKNIKSEFKKVVWPSKDTVKKETTAVILCTAALGVIIAVLDGAIKIGIDFIANVGL